MIPCYSTISRIPNFSVSIKLTKILSLLIGHIVPLSLLLHRFCKKRRIKNLFLKRNQVIKMRLKLAVLWLALVAISCDQTRFYETNFPIENKTWNYQEKLKFEVAVQDTLSGFNFLVNLRHTEAYQYSNFYFLNFSLNSLFFSFLSIVSFSIGITCMTTSATNSCKQ